MKILFILSFCLCSLTGFSQSPQDEPKEGVKTEGAHQAEYNADTPIRDHSAEINSRNENERLTEGSGSTDSAGVSFGDQSAASAANTAGTDTRTTSSSGSPALLHAEGPDGTNTMQRATLNIAGSPVPRQARSAAKKQSLSDRSQSRTVDNNATPARERKPTQKKKK